MRCRAQLNGLWDKAGERLLYGGMVSGLFKMIVDVS